MIVILVKRKEMTGKRLKVNSNVLVLLALLEFAISIASESCPNGTFYFNNSIHNEPVPDVNITTTVTPGANCYNCSSDVPNCRNCTGWLPNTDRSACLREEASDASPFPWWGGLLIALAIIGVVLGAVGGYMWWKNREDQDLPEPLPEPDGKENSFKKVNGDKKKKRNSYIKDPIKPVQRIPPSIYGQTERYSQEGGFSNSLFTEVKQNVEPGVIPGVDPGASGGQGQASNPVYENFSGRGKAKNKVMSKYPGEIEMGQEIYMNT